MDEVRFDLRGVREAKERLAALGAKVDDFAPLWERIAGVMIQVETEWFESEGGGQWPPLAESTLDWKLEHGYPEDILVRTGALLDSLTTTDAYRVEQFRSTIGTFTSKSFSWGTDVVDERGRFYAHYHQGTVPETGELADYDMPVRQVIEWPLAPSTDAMIELAMEEFLAEAVKESGL